MRSKRYLPILCFLAALLFAACRPSETSTTVIESFVSGECDGSTIPIDMNTTYQHQVEQGSYPASCSFYCLWVPESGSSLEIGISRFGVDLDMYVDTNLSVLASSETGTGRWESDNYGSGNESVTIGNPSGRYYIQVCSYEGEASTFNLWNKYTP